MARGSFHEDWSDMLERFAHRGTPAALEDQLLEAKPKETKFRRRCRAFQLNQALFEASVTGQRGATNSQIDKAKSPATGGS